MFWTIFFFLTYRGRHFRDLAYVLFLVIPLTQICMSAIITHSIEWYSFLSIQANRHQSSSCKICRTTKGLSWELLLYSFPFRGLLRESGGGGDSTRAFSWLVTPLLTPFMPCLSNFYFLFFNLLYNESSPGILALGDITKFPQCAPYWALLQRVVILSCIDAVLLNVTLKPGI